MRLRGKREDAVSEPTSSSASEETTAGTLLVGCCL
jgi:hypothetical protein